MRSRVHTSIVVALALGIIALPSSGAQVEHGNDSPAAALAGAVPIERLLAAVAKRTGKKFIVDPRVRGDVIMVGSEPTSIDYPTLLLVLRIHGFAAVEQGGYVEVIPDANVR